MPDLPRLHRPLYRVFHLNREGAIERADIIEAADDDDAIRRIMTIATDHACELWDRARFVAKAEPPASAAVRLPTLSRAAVSPAATSPLEIKPTVKPAHP